MTKEILALFPGQGSQKVGMGTSLFQSSEEAKQIFAAADKALGFGLSELCFKGPEEALTATAVAQPAILTVSTICYRLFSTKAGPDFLPKIAAGHSLGEYSALVAAEALSFEDAVLLVHKRGRYMQEAVPKGEGSMLAVLGKELSEIEAAVSQVKDGIVEVANVNAPGQVVVAGDMKGLAELKTIMSGSKLVELNVSAPFHCRLMKPAADSLKKDLSAITINRCRFPVISNYTALPASSPEEVRSALAEQVCGRVRWVESMQHAVNSHPGISSFEFGSGNVLNGMLKRISSETARVNIQDNQESIDEGLKKLL